MDSPEIVTGAIVDSWVERVGPDRKGRRLVLQVAQRGKPDDLMIVEAEASLVPDIGWLEDLRSNLCHGSLVAAVGRLTISGQLKATELRLGR
jgi:hypothetical protein